MPAPAVILSPSASGPAPDLAALLAELDDLTDRAAALRARLAALRAPGAPRPGWPIRRVGPGPGTHAAG
jgi:hypothetical protein